MEDLDGLWKKFLLSELEDDKFTPSSTNEHEKPTLVAKFFTQWVINVEAVTRTFKPLWRSESGFSAQELGENLMMFEFEDVADLEKVLLYEPWTNDKYLVAFWRLEGTVEPENLVFNQTSFWVQIHDLSMLSLKK